MNNQTISAYLLALQSEEQPVRTAALNSLRSLPRHEFPGAWAEHRAVDVPDGWFLDPLGRVRIQHPETPIIAERAVAVAFTPGYAHMTGALLRTLVKSGDYEGVAIIVFSINAARLPLETELELARVGMDVHYVECIAVERLSNWVKTALYAVAHSPQIQVESIVALESDMLVVGSLAPLWSALEVAHPSAIMGVRPQTLPQRLMLSEVLMRCNRPMSDVNWMMGAPFDAPFWFNGGLLAGRRAAWAELDANMRALFPFSAAWIEGFTWYYGEEFVMNLGVGLMENRVELSPAWNVQFVQEGVTDNVAPQRTEKGMIYSKGRERARVLHLVTGAKTLLAPMMAEIEANGIAPDSAQAVSPLPSNPFIKCRQCPVRRTCGSCFEPSTFAAERRASGERSAICRLCFARNEGKSEEQIDEELKELATELRLEQERASSAS